MAVKKKKIKWHTIPKILLISAGSLFLCLCILAFTTIPFHAYYALGTRNSKITRSPSTIIMLGGAGIPSGDGLIRTYYTARLSSANPKAAVIIAIPGDTADLSGAPALAVEELTLRGVKRGLISLENLGRNTREQALKLSAGKTSAQLSEPVILVTSPEHMRRAILTFRKCGFKAVSGFPAFEIPLDANLTFNDSDLQGNKFAPPIGKNLQFRYQFWNHLKYEIVVLREYLGLSYYKLRGWV